MKQYRANKKNVDEKDKKKIEMKKYRASKATAEDKAVRNAYLKNYRARMASREQKAKHNAYMRNYRARMASPEQKAKHNAYMRNKRAKMTSLEQKAKRNAYQRTKRAQVASHDEKSKHNAYMKAYRAKPKSKIELTISKFHEIIAQGLLYICTCCDQLWYKHSVLNAKKLTESSPDIRQYLRNKTSVDDVEWVCKTCHSHLTKNKIPPYAVVPLKPTFFDLNELEFQKLMQAPRGRQLKIHGNVVNVPADVTDTVNMLPRLACQDGTIKVNLKRKLPYKSSALSLNIRPHKVVQAADWLMRNSSLYRGNCF